MTDAVPDEPLGSHVLELQIADVIAETDDSRSLVFAVPDGPDDPAIPAERLVGNSVRQDLTLFTHN